MRKAVKYMDRKELKKQRERSFEYGLPDYLQHDLDTYKEALKTHDHLLDCYWGELYGSINIAEINDNAITHEHAEYLRKKFLWGVIDDEEQGNNINM